jgi:hypothetical protein
MKTMLQSLAFAVLATISVQANAQMKDSLQKTFDQLENATNLEKMDVNTLVPISAKFDLIANQYPDQWVANYYAAYIKALIAYQDMEAAKKDAWLDQANVYFERVKTLNPESDERYVLGALLANSRLAVDGQARWQEYGKIFDENLEKAKAINPNNPRIYYLKGAALFYTPKMFGGGAKKAKPYFEKANTLFTTQHDILVPYWGQKQTTYFLAECEK